MGVGCKGGLLSNCYPWGNEKVSSGEVKCNYWSGKFPTENSKKDGFYYTALFIGYQPNGYGLYNMAGNVWKFVPIGLMKIITKTVLI